MNFEIRKYIRMIHVRSMKNDIIMVNIKLLSFIYLFILKFLLTILFCFRIVFCFVPGLFINTYHYFLPCTTSKDCNIQFYVYHNNVILHAPDYRETGMCWSKQKCICEQVYTFLSNKLVRL
jgi:hypothetical protein